MLVFLRNNREDPIQLPGTHNPEGHGRRRAQEMAEGSKLGDRDGCSSIETLRYQMESNDSQCFPIFFFFGSQIMLLIS